MGNINCCANSQMKYDEKNKIYQINRLQEENSDKDSNLENNKEDNINKISLNNGQYKLLTYDIEENTLFTYIIKIPIINSLKGLSELNFNSKLYLCGTSSIDEDESSYLFEITFQTLSTKIMVSSQFGHYYPSLISINNNKIMCIGGKNQTKCELYDTIINHWATISDLPEERYKCTLCFNYKTKYLYLFGGINSNKYKSNLNYIEKESILRINTRNNCGSIWEKIFVESKLGNKLLTRISSASLLLDDNNIILIGGINENGKILKNIIKFNLRDNNVSLTGQNLDYPSKFINQSITTGDNKNEENNNINYFFDTKNNIHIINKQNYSSNPGYNEELKINITN